MYKLMCKNHAMYVEAMRLVHSSGFDYEAQPDECTIILDLDDDDTDAELEQFEAFGELNF